MTTKIETSSSTQIIKTFIEERTSTPRYRDELPADLDQSLYESMAQRLLEQLDVTQFPWSNLFVDAEETTEIVGAMLTLIEAEAHANVAAFKQTLFLLAELQRTLAHSQN